MIGEHDEILDAIDTLERKTDNVSHTLAQCMSDLVRAMEINSALILELGKVVYITTSPDKKDLEKHKTLREAYEQYIFVRKLTLGE